MANSSQNLLLNAEDSIRSDSFDSYSQKSSKDSFSSIRRKSSSYAETAYVVKDTVRASLVLMPLLGLSQLLVFINPFHKQENVFDGLWILMSILIRTSQGAMVSFAYCFTNKEVLKCIRRRRMTLAGKIAIYFGCDGGSEINGYSYAKSYNGSFSEGTKQFGRNICRRNKSFKKIGNLLEKAVGTSSPKLMCDSSTIDNVSTTGSFISATSEKDLHQDDDNCENNENMENNENENFEEMFDNNNLGRNESYRTAVNDGNCVVPVKNHTKWYEICSDYRANDEDEEEISVVKGQIVKLISDVSEGFTMIADESGETGKIPRNCLMRFPLTALELDRKRQPFVSVCGEENKRKRQYSLFENSVARRVSFKRQISLTNTMSTLGSPDSGSFSFGKRESK